MIGRLICWAQGHRIAVVIPWDTQVREIRCLRCRYVQEPVSDEEFFRGAPEQLRAYREHQAAREAAGS